MLRLASYWFRCGRLRFWSNAWFLNPWVRVSVKVTNLLPTVIKHPFQNKPASLLIPIEFSFYRWPEGVLGTTSLSLFIQGVLGTNNLSPLIQGDSLKESFYLPGYFLFFRTGVIQGVLGTNNLSPLVQ